MSVPSMELPLVDCCGREAVRDMVAITAVL